MNTPDPGIIRIAMLLGLASLVFARSFGSCAAQTHA